MNIEAVIIPGVNEITVHGLHQWDYGRTLEIHTSELPAIVEVHFACAGMTEAVVRRCSGVDGVYEAVIPDICLEQTSPVYAWVYVIEENGGATTTTIVMPITARIPPQQDQSIPRTSHDAYTELIAAVNDAIDEAIYKLENGEVVVDQALKANQSNSAKFANRADESDHASEADHAILADRATSAGHAVNADNASNASEARSARTAEKAHVLMGEYGEKYSFERLISALPLYGPNAFRIADFTYNTTEDNYIDNVPEPTPQDTKHAPLNLCGDYTGKTFLAKIVAYYNNELYGVSWARLDYAKYMKHDPAGNDVYATPYHHSHPHIDMHGFHLPYYFYEKNGTTHLYIWRVILQAWDGTNEKVVSDTFDKWKFYIEDIFVEKYE